MDMLTSKTRLPVREILLIGILPSFVKKLVYKLKGYRIGSGVHFGFGSVVIGGDVEIGDGVRMGIFSAIRCETLRLGRYAQIGAVTMIDTPHVEIGEDTKFNEYVFVGGLQFPDSRLVVGKNCLIMQSSYINPCRSIFIGDDSGVGVNCLLIGHASWQSKFEGYPVSFQPIVIGNSVALAWRVTVLPGTTIGDGATIGAHSLVKETIPPRCLAVGFPARVVVTEPYYPRRVKETEKVQYFREIISEMLQYWRGSGFQVDEKGPVMELRRMHRRWFFEFENTWRFAMITEVLPNEDLRDVDLLLSLRRIPEERRNEFVRRKQMWIDLEKKERSDFGNDIGEEVAHYLKRYGVRLLRARS